ncbi:MAG: hypothetical protein JXQ76_01640 [Campylobacterales bacterium]|nr:hypothetical protein [Campylobacterales bacterium]
MVNRDNSRLEEDKYDQELEQNRLTIAKQVDEYYSGTSTLYTQKEADAKMQSFMNELKVKHADS